MFDAARVVARTDFDDAGAAAQAAGSVRRVLSLLEEHAGHEDRVILPEVAQLGPAVFADLQAEHSRIAGLQTEIAQLLDRLLAAPSPELPSLGRRLHERMSHLVAEHLRHMAVEETTANRLLWAHRTDEELRTLQGRVLGAIPPERMRTWAEIMLPAISPVERAAVMSGLETKLPAEALTRLSVLVQGLVTNGAAAGGGAAV
jgi:hypothetical protein